MSKNEDLKTEEKNKNIIEKYGYIVFWLMVIFAILFKGLEFVIEFFTINQLN